MPDKRNAPAKRVERPRHLADWPGLPAGSFCFDRSQDGRIFGLTHNCPCGCGFVSFCGIRPLGPTSNSWDWNGDIDRPTLQPSVQIKSPCRWHGHLIDGEWREE